MKTQKPNVKMAICTLALFALASCRNSPDIVETTPGGYAFKQPVVTPLVFTKPQKIDWAKVKSTRVMPVVEKLDLDKIPSAPYTDTTAASPFSYAVETVKFDYNDLPSRDLDISKLPSKPLKFGQAVINPPLFIKAGPPHLSRKGKGLIFELSESQGLAGVVCTAMFTDRDGFLWIANDRGVYRYDGQNLVLYVREPMSRIFCMVEDQSGRIWMSSLDDGIAVLDPKTGILRPMSKKEGLVSNNTVKILIDSKERIWATTKAGVNIIDTKKRTISILGEAQGFSGKSAGFLTARPDNNLWINASSAGINVIDLKNNKIRYIRKAQGLKSDSLSAIFCDRQGRIWSVSREGIFISVFDVKNGTIQYVNEMQNLKNDQNTFSLVQGISEDNNGNIWICTVNKGVKIINLDKRQIKTLTISGIPGDEADFSVASVHDKRGNTWIATVNGLYLYKQSSALVEHIGNYVVSTVAEDDQGLLWEGDLSGLHIINLKDKTVKFITTKQGLSNDSVQAISKINGKMFVSTNSSVDIFDKKRKTIAHIGLPQGFSGTSIGTVLVDKTSDIWMSSSTGIDIFDPQKGTSRHFDKADGLTGNNINDIQLDEQNRLWAGAQNGQIDIIDLQAGTISHLADRPGLKGNGIKVFLHNDKGNIWIGTVKGVYMADQKNKTLSFLSTPQGLIDEAITSLSQYGGNVYAGTAKGISEIMPPLNGTDTSWRAISVGKDDNLNRTISGYFLQDGITHDGHYLWGDNGITIVDLSAKEKQATQAFITGFNLMDQPMFFAYQAKTDYQKDESTTQYNVGGKITGPYNLPADLRLPNSNSNLQFHFARADLGKLDTPWYHYMLEGADHKWSGRTRETSTGNYFSLPPGKYTFKVAALNNNSTWGVPAAFSFTILPPWWQTWWARTLFVLAFIGIIWAFVSYRSLSLIKEKRLLEHKVNVRTKEVMEQKEEIASQRDSLQHALDDLKNTQSQLVQREKMASLGELTAGIAHEIQNPLNFVNNFSEVNQEMIDELEDELKKGNISGALALTGNIKDNEEKVRHHGKRAESIVKGMLEHSRNNSGERQLADINALADEYLRLAYHGLRAKEKNFNAELITRFGEKLPKINIVQQDIGRVLLNLFNNAFYAVNEKKKTAGANYKPEVSVTTTAENGNIIIKVKDNGNGIAENVKDKIMQPFFTTKPTGEGTGLGLSLSYDIVVKGHGGKIDITSTENIGSEFIISLPMR